MKMKGLSCIVFALSLIACGETSQEEIPETSAPKPEGQRLIFHYEDEFSTEDKLELRKFVESTTDDVQAVLGEYPFNIHYYIIKSEGNPVVFGRARRSEGRRKVILYVSPGYTKDEYRESWIGPHEIAHLGIPVVGQGYRWFSEGFATYFSREIMCHGGILTREEVDSINLSRLKMHAHWFNTPTPLTQYTDSLKDNHIYPPFYWAGASYFYKADRQLRAEKEMTLSEVLIQYQQVRAFEDRVLEIIADWDSISQSTIFTDLFIQYDQGPSSQIMKEFIED